MTRKDMLLRRSKNITILLITLTTSLITVSLCSKQSDSFQYTEQTRYQNASQTEQENLLKRQDTAESYNKTFDTSHSIKTKSNKDQEEILINKEKSEVARLRVLQRGPDDWPDWRNDRDDRNDWSRQWEIDRTVNENSSRNGNGNSQARIADDLSDPDDDDDDETDDDNQGPAVAIVPIHTPQVEEDLIESEVIIIQVEEEAPFEEIGIVEEEQFLLVEEVEEIVVVVEEENYIIEEAARPTEQEQTTIEAAPIEEELIIIVEETSQTEEYNNEELELRAEEHIIVAEDLIVQPNTGATCANSSYYYFPNGTCLPECSLNTFIAGTNLDNGQNTCIPCHSSCATCSGLPDSCTSCSSEFPYFFLNMTCQKTCPLETNQVTELEGNTLCIAQNATVRYKNSSNDTNSTTPQQKRLIQVVQSYNSVGGTVASVSVATAQVLNKGSCPSAPAMLLINLITYIKYLDINYPPKLHGIFQNQVQDIISFDFIPGFPDANSPKVTKYTASARFARYGVSGLFLVNFWEELFTTIVIGFTAILIKLLIKRAFRHPLIRKILDWAERFLIWNFILTFMFSNLGDAVLFSIIEFESLNLDSGLAVVSFLFNLLFFIGYLALQAFAFVKLYKLHSKQKFKNNEEKTQMNSSIRILFEDSKSDSFFQEILISITSIKVVLSAIIIAAIDAPVAQTVLLLLLNIAMAAYLIIFRPLKTPRKNLELIIYEILMFIGIAACLGFAVQDPESQSTNRSAEDTIIVINLIFISCVIFFQVLDFGLETKKFVCEYISKRKSAKVHPVNATEPKGTLNTKTVETIESNPTTEENQDAKLTTEKAKENQKFSLKVITASGELRRVSSLDSQGGETSDNTALTRISTNNLIDPSPKSGLDP